MSSIQGLTNQRGKYPAGFVGQQPDDPEVVLYEVVVERREVRQNRREHDEKNDKPALSHQVTRYLKTSPIMRAPVTSAPLRVPVIFDSPTRPR